MLILMRVYCTVATDYCTVFAIFVEHFGVVLDLTANAMIRCKHVERCGEAR